MTRLQAFLRNRNGIFLLAVTAGLLFPGVASGTAYLVLPALALAMTLSMLEIDSMAFTKPRTRIFPALLGIVMSYFILGNIIIALGAWLINDEALWTGFVLLAAAPPVIAAIPLSGVLQGNSPLSLFGTIGAYLGALVIIPLISWTLLNPATFDPFKLILITLGLIILPLAISRLLIREGWQGRIGPYRGTVVNWSFFIIFYTAIGLNRDLLLGDAGSLLPIALISFISMFLLGFLIDWVCGLFHIPQDTRVSLVLLGTLKNQGLAGGLALTMFNPEAAIPATVAMVIMIGYILWLDFHKQRA